MKRTKGKRISTDRLGKINPRPGIFWKTNPTNKQRKITPNDINKIMKDYDNLEKGRKKSLFNLGMVALMKLDNADIKITFLELLDPHSKVMKRKK